MKRFLNTHFLVFVHFLAIAAVISIAAWVTHASRNEMKTLIEARINSQTALLGELSIITDRNGADEVITRIVTDCPRRNEFDQLLIGLGKLQHRDLIILQQLFDSCGAFYSERKALMVSRLARELATLQDDANLLHVIDPERDVSSLYIPWERLVDLEFERSALLSEQTSLQQQIITALLGGSHIAAKDVTDLVSKAGQVGESLSVIDIQIDAIRNDLGA